MTSLVIDTSTDQSVVAIVENETLMWSADIPWGYQNSCDIPFSISYLKDIKVDRVVIGVGPGSYTGLRAAFVIGRTFAYCRNIDIFTVCSLKGFLPCTFDEDGVFLIAISARSAGWYSLSCRIDSRFVNWGKAKVVSSIGDCASELASSFVFSPTNIQGCKVSIVHIDPVRLVIEADRDKTVWKYTSMYKGMLLNYVRGNGGYFGRAPEKLQIKH